MYGVKQLQCLYSFLLPVHTAMYQKKKQGSVRTKLMSNHPALFKTTMFLGITTNYYTLLRMNYIILTPTITLTR